MRLVYSSTTATILLSPLALAAPSCRNVTIPVTISATNVQIPLTVNLANLTTYLSLSAQEVVDIPVSGTYNINGRYCEPEVQIAGRNDTLQFLNHGLAQTLHYWSGQDFVTPYHGTNYSWIAYASTQGYPTLAIDRLGNGLSDHPDPITVVQLPAQVEVAHEVIASIHGGVLDRNFTEVVYIGHSFGSITGHILNAKYPSDVSRTILTGWSSTVDQSGLGVLLSDDAKPAAIVQPSRFGSLPAGYLEATSKNGSASLVFYGAGTSTAGEYYDQGLAFVDFVVRGTQTVGEVYTLALFASTSATNYTGKVLVQTGEGDAFFCGTGFGNGNCGVGATSIPALSQVLYPDAASYDYFVLLHTGHETVFHYTQQQSFANAHDWLAATA